MLDPASGAPTEMPTPAACVPGDTAQEEPSRLAQRSRRAGGGGKRVGVQGSRRHSADSIGRLPRQALPGPCGRSTGYMHTLL